MDQKGPGGAHTVDAEAWTHGFRLWDWRWVEEERPLEWLRGSAQSHWAANLPAPFRTLRGRSRWAGSPKLEPRGPRCCFLQVLVTLPVQLFLAEGVHSLRCSVVGLHGEMELPLLVFLHLVHIPAGEQHRCSQYPVQRLPSYLHYFPLLVDDLPRLFERPEGALPPDPEIASLLAFRCWS